MIVPQLTHGSLFFDGGGGVTIFFILATYTHIRLFGMYDMQTKLYKKSIHFLFVTEKSKAL